MFSGKKQGCQQSPSKAPPKQYHDEFLSGNKQGSIHECNQASISKYASTHVCKRRREERGQISQSAIVREETKKKRLTDRQSDFSAGNCLQACVQALNLTSVLQAAKLKPSLNMRACDRTNPIPAAAAGHKTLTPDWTIHRRGPN